MNDNLLSFLGLCRRAGKLVIGADPCVKSIKDGKSKLIIYANDFSRSSLKPVLEAASGARVTALEIDRSKNELSLALGKLCGVASVENAGFAKKLRSMAENEQRGEIL